MGIPIASIDRVSVPRQRDTIPQDRGFARQQQLAQSRAAALRSAAIDRFEASLPGNDDPRDIRATAADFERISLAFNKKLQFVVDHQSHEVTVKVIDPATDKVIKVLPPEELQRLHNKIRETIGFLFDESV
jgi:flagellar protein FlaG